MIDDIATKYQIHPNDISIQSTKIEILRGIDLCARLLSNLKTTTIFESQEVYLKILLQLNKDNEELKDKLSLFKSLPPPKQFDVAIQTICYSYFWANPLSVKKLKQYLECQKINLDDYQFEYENLLIYINKLSNNRYKNQFNNQLEKFRKNKKNHYWMNSATVKLSTIHSFKGWEIDTLFLVIEKGSNLEALATDELIYTALTRCRHNLFILDCDKSRYASFFKAVLNI